MGAAGSGFVERASWLLRLPLETPTIAVRRRADRLHALAEARLPVAERVHQGPDGDEHRRARDRVG